MIFIVQYQCGKKEPRGWLFPGSAAFGHTGAASGGKGKLLQCSVIGIHLLVDFGASAEFMGNFLNLLMVRIAGQALISPKITTANRMPPAHHRIKDPVLEDPATDFDGHHLIFESLHGAGFDARFPARFGIA